MKIQKDKMHLSMAGMIIGGAIMLIGAINTVKDAVDEAEEKAEKGESGVVFKANVLGLAIGLPVFGISLYLYNKASNEFDSLRLQKMRIGIYKTTPYVALDFEIPGF